MRGLWAVSMAAVASLGITAAVNAAGDDAIAPLSVKFTSAGEAALDRKDPTAAIDAFETALAADPRNARAFIGIARAYEAQGLPGRAVKYYREALAIEPNDLGALEGQGKALIARGATTRAKVNLDRIKLLCKGDCPQAKRLEVALAAPPPPVPPTAPLASVEPVKSSPVRN